MLAEGRVEVGELGVEVHLAGDCVLAHADLSPRQLRPNQLWHRGQSQLLN